ncbi:Hypothetical Protein FCC1311_048302 [Hondaea fermentalgiana]|uniref:Uncharacterized protein n=1 Tax=Hondaea fermentalgiana TaxID=2315210 RepID=A0A2R5GE53_9STRA|nr:Hypothetical Protein FCC1311_048302 [Hondaea fermentalgiana]|eukprot:GBG28609.1 Hypothetical Protein FCC1311_048302 [Hondaea fermentalgiana]
MDALVACLTGVADDAKDAAGDAAPGDRCAPGAGSGASAATGSSAFADAAAGPSRTRAPRERRRARDILARIVDEKTTLRGADFTHLFYEVTSSPLEEGYYDRLPDCTTAELIFENTHGKKMLLMKFELPPLPGVETPAVSLAAAVGVPLNRASKPTIKATTSVFANVGERNRHSGFLDFSWDWSQHDAPNRYRNDDQTPGCATRVLKFKERDSSVSHASITLRGVSTQKVTATVAVDVGQKNMRRAFDRFSGNSDIDAVRIACSLVKTCYYLKESPGMHTR